MILHLGYEIPVQQPKDLDSENERLTAEEVRIVKDQIRKNTVLINGYVRRIDLFVNQEQYPHQEAFLEGLRARLFLLIDENDTFRAVLWKHLQRENMGALS